MGDEIESAIQHAPQPTLQSNVSPRYRRLFKPYYSVNILPLMGLKKYRFDLIQMPNPNELCLREVFKQFVYCRNFQAFLQVRDD